LAVPCLSQLEGSKLTFAFTRRESKHDDTNGTTPSAGGRLFRKNLKRHDDSVRRKTDIAHTSCTQTSPVFASVVIMLSRVLLMCTAALSSADLAPASSSWLASAAATATEEQKRALQQQQQMMHATASSAVSMQSYTFELDDMFFYGKFGQYSSVNISLVADTGIDFWVTGTHLSATDY
jgi:hypothetical protein